MKIIKVFTFFLIVHLAAWAGTHWYLGQHKEEVLLVVDTSYSMKSKFPDMAEWIEQFDTGSRYKVVMIGTDKAPLGVLSELKSQSVIFRTSFGRMTKDSLNHYRNSEATQKILLSDGSIQPEGWRVVSF